ncbi:hypothetical protein SPRG_00737 [Saprolegnia parasitica CBS 223.65]|uniref:Uncharacterized protein n=1 Tax=Saprolegnia parasitica (strain CBS 223.65) TaxID=695850 RepID=A0A067CVI4_SAPPC|nr:hypothetical protein SPRG_00737 [Saprolegnia parasitica CBS 223.65]KDO34674.1 hypothetical protein SPRG_00737 [Saprolegnia parasitica CBS 223.65]|eukprot:XP_012194347.1 hypothetical protein SPRG_00737 [Saprolegnia parasitica CBS 223.65]
MQVLPCVDCPRADLADDSMACMLLAVERLLSARPPKRVAFTTATTYMFDVAYGGSSLPKESGPPIGLAPTHFAATTACINDMPRTGAGRVRKFDHLERIALLKDAEYDVREIAAFCLEAIDVRKSRMETHEELTALRRKRKLQASHDRAKRRCVADPTSTPETTLHMQT